MTQMNGKIRRELTDLLANHLAAEASKHGRWDFLDLAEIAMEFIYGEDLPQQNDPAVQDATGCGGCDLCGRSHPGPGIRDGVRTSLTGVVHPPTTVGEHLTDRFVRLADLRLRTEESGPARESGSGPKAP